MKWEYKNHIIEVDDEGCFTFTSVNGILYSRDSLSKAKGLIDELMAEYYNMTQEQYKQLLGKLTDREKDFVKSIVDELRIHEDNAYCEIGLRYFDFTLPKNE